MNQDGDDNRDEADGEVDWTQQTSGTFADFGLSEGVMGGIRELGFEAPTPVQRAVLDPIRGGADVIIQSKTGSGKTAAFGIPLAERLGEPGPLPQALVLAPTRELAQQVEREVGVLVRGAGHSAALVIGGVGYGPQVTALQGGASVIAGTPGRVLDHLKRGTFDTSDVRIVVLDEADETLSMGFWEEVTAILDRMPKDRQTVLLSATLPPELERTAKRYLRDPERHELTGDVAMVLGVENILYFPDDNIPPTRNLLYILETERPDSALIFCNTKAESDGLAVYLRRFGFRVDVIHGDLSQRERERAMGRLRSGDIDLLVATDVAARGIDISDLSHVVNNGLPEYPEVYVHRVGRTGRIGKRGTAVTLLSGRDAATVSTVQKRYGVSFISRRLPPEQEVLAMQAERLVEKILAASNSVEFEMYVPVALKMCETEEGRRAVGFLLRQYFAEDTQPRRAGDRGTERAGGVRLYVSLGADEGTDEELLAALTAVEGVAATDVFSVERQSTSAFLQVAGPGEQRLVVIAGVVESAVSRPKVGQHRLGQILRRHEPAWLERRLVQLDQALDEVGIVLEIARKARASLVPRVQ